MLATKQIAEEFSRQGVQWNDMLLIPPEVALDFVNRCEEFNLEILGVEGFIYYGATIESQIDLVVQFSKKHYETWDARVEDCALSAREFLERLPHRPNLMLYFSVLTKEDRSIRRIFQLWFHRVFG